MNYIKSQDALQVTEEEVRNVSQYIQDILADVKNINALCDAHAAEDAEGLAEAWGNPESYNSFYRERWGYWYNHISSETSEALEGANGRLCDIWPDHSPQRIHGAYIPSAAEWRRFVSGRGRRRFNRLRRRIRKLVRQNRFYEPNKFFRDFNDFDERWEWFSKIAQ